MFLCSVGLILIHCIPYFGTSQMKFQWFEPPLPRLQRKLPSLVVWFSSTGTCYCIVKFMVDILSIRNKRTHFSPLEITRLKYKRSFLWKLLLNIILSQFCLFKVPSTEIKQYYKLENRICRQIQDLHASSWCKRVEEPQES